jgi:hypothetical protein
MKTPSLTSFATSDDAEKISGGSLRSTSVVAILVEMAARPDVRRALYRSGLGEIRGLIFG